MDERPPAVADRAAPGPLGKGLAAGPCERFGVRHPGRADDAVYVAGAADSQGRRDRTEGLRTRSADTAHATPTLPHVRSGARNARAPSLHEADAQPQCPWERGTNETATGLLRPFFPKGTRFNQVSRHAIRRVQAMFNDRPRKSLNWHSPAHAFPHLLH
jgi:hypothetical protein